MASCSGIVSRCKASSTVGIGAGSRVGDGVDGDGDGDGEAISVMVVDPFGGEPADIGYVASEFGADDTLDAPPDQWKAYLHGAVDDHVRPAGCGFDTSTPERNREPRGQ